MPPRRQQPSRGNPNPEPTAPTHALCGAKKHNSTDTCARPAGWGTTHPGTGRCKLHGGCNTGPKDREKMSKAAMGNKNGRKHGMFEKIVVENMSPEEREKFEKIGDDRDLKTELKILRYKLMRLLDPVERAQIVNLGEGEQEIQMIEIDEVTKAYAIERLIDGIRKVMRDMKDTDDEHDSFEQLLTQIAAIRMTRKVTEIAEDA
jgi:hypothetical protein